MVQGGAAGHVGLRVAKWEIIVTVWSGNLPRQLPGPVPLGTRAIVADHCSQTSGYVLQCVD